LIPAGRQLARSRRSRGWDNGRVWRCLLALALFVAPPRLGAQTLTVRTVSNELHVRTSGLGFISGKILERLQDGRSVRIDFEVTVLEKPQGTTVARAQQSFNLSFDLWEQRFAVTRIGPMPRSISHLTARAAEDWCLDNVSVPLTALSRIGRDTPFWLRVDYRVPDRTPAAEAGESTFTLQTLIDVLSRRGEDENRGKSVEAGPFRLSD
jgi:hypothetical protein